MHILNLLFSSVHKIGGGSRWSISHGTKRCSSGSKSLFTGIVMIQHVLYARGYMRCGSASREGLAAASALLCNYFNFRKPMLDIAPNWETMAYKGKI
jgi:hypothetical protein